MRVEAASLADAFATAAHGVMEWMGPPPDSGERLTERIELGAEDRSELLVRWLQELLFLFQQRNCYWTDVQILGVTDRKIEATITGLLWDATSVPGFQEIKAVTYHEAELIEERGTWRARLILDI